MKILFILTMNAHLFDLNTNVTTDSTVTIQMKEFYAKHLLDTAQPKLIHDQWAVMEDIPKNGGKTVEFRGFKPLAKALTPLTEGVTPDGMKMEAYKVNATIKQYGTYIALADILLATTVDPMLLKANKELARQAGKTLDTVSREVMNAGTSVQYADDSVGARYLLVGGESSGNHYLDPTMISRASTTLKGVDAPTADGEYYAGIIHPHVVGDIRLNSDWADWNKYTTPEAMYKGEIGRIHGVRFIETTESKVFHAENLTTDSRNLTVASLSTKTFTIDEALSTAQAAALVTRKLIIKGYLYTVASAVAGAAGAATVTVTEAVQGTPGDGEIIYPGEAGAKGRDVYSTLILGSEAYGTTKVDSLGLQSIIKQLGQGEDPLNQRATTGWKATKITTILINLYMIRIETASRMQVGAAN